MSDPQDSDFDPPLVSVIIPTRNRPRLLDRAVRSALAQSYSRVEVWVLDDASDPPVRLESHAASDPRVNLVRPDKHLGSAAARNTGVSRSSGSLVAFLDDDDYWLPEKVSREVEVLMGSPPDVGAVDSGYELRSGARVIRRHLPDPDRNLRLELLQWPCLLSSTVMMRRTTFDDVGGFDESLARTDDWDLWVRLLDRYWVVAIPEIHTVRRAHGAISDEEMLEQTVAFYRRLGPRLDSLSDRDRRKVQARHRFDEAALLAKVGRRKEARSMLGRAWRLDPVWIKPLVHLGRAVTGEKLWGHIKRFALGARTLAFRAVGWDPLRRR